MTRSKTLIILATGAALAVGAIYAGRAAQNDPDRLLSRADKHFSQGAYDEARLGYLKALRSDSQNARAIRQMGLTWSEMGSPIQAGIFLAHMERTSPGDVEVQQALVRALLATGQLGEARQTAAAILDQKPTDEAAFLVYANTSFTPEQIEEVKQRLEKLDPKTSVAYHLVSAVTAGRNRDLESAKTSLDAALAINPESPEVHLAFASYYEAVKEKTKATASLKKAADLSGPTSPNRIRYIQNLVQNGQKEEATALLKEMTESARFYLPAWTLLADLTLKDKDPKKALDMLDEVLSRDPANPEAKMVRAAALQAQGKGQESVRELTEMAKIYPGNPVVKMAIAQGHIANRETGKAISALQEVVQLTPQNTEAVLLLARLQIADGQAIVAGEMLQKVLEMRPGLPQAEQLLAAALQAQGKYGEAAEIFRGQIARDDDQARPHFLLGLMLRQQNKPQEALASLEKAQSLAPADPAIAYQLIEMDLERKDFDSAHQRAARQAELTPGTWSPLYLRGKVFTAQENWPAAEEALLAALALEPDSLTIYDLLLTGYMKQNRLPDVIARLEEFLAKKPDSIPQRLTLAMLYGKSGDTTKEAATYEEILAKEPELATALNNLAYLNAGPLNNPERAMELATRARSLQPDSPSIADTLGWIYFQQKDYAKALPLIEEAAAQLSDNPEVQYHLGMARYMLGQRESAKSALTKAVAAGVEFAGIDKAKEYLAQLENTGSPGDPAATMESLQARLKKTPGDVTARLKLAELQASAGKAAEAADTYQEALKANAGLPEALIALSRLYAGPLKDPEQATNFARRARALDSRSPAAARALGLAVLHQGDFRYAFSLLKEAAAAGPLEPAMELSMARAAYGSGNLAEARAQMEKIASRTATAPETKEALQFLDLTADPSAESVAAATAAKPASLAAQMAEARLAFKSGDTAKTATITESILKEFPDFVPAQPLLAKSLAGNPQRLDDALSWAAKARQALPEDPGTARTFGILRYQKGDHDQAARLLKESDSREKLDSEGRFYLGMAQINNNEKEEGLTNLKLALEANLPDGLKKQAEEAVANAEAPPEAEATEP